MGDVVGSSKRPSGGGVGAASAAKRSRAEGELQCAVCLTKLKDAAGKYVNADVAVAEGCGCYYCTGCLLEGISTDLPDKYVCVAQGCGGTVTSWTRFKAAVRRGAGGVDVRKGVQGAVAGGAPWRWWVMPSVFLDYFASTPEEQQLSSVVSVAYPHVGDLDAQLTSGVLRVNADERPLSVEEKLSRGTLLDALSLQLHHGVVARDERVVSSGADSCVLGIDDLEPRVLAESMTQRFLRIMGTGRVSRREDASADQHRQKELYMPWVASEVLFSTCRAANSKASSLLGSTVTTLYELLPTRGFMGFLRQLGLATGLQW